MSRGTGILQGKVRLNRTGEFSPERLLNSLFIKASLLYPSNISGQGIWLTLLFRQGQADGKISQRVSLYMLKEVLSGDAKDDVLEAIIQAAHKAHHHLEDKPSLAPQSVGGIVGEVLSASFPCQSFDDRQLYALLEILPIYMQVMEYVSGNETLDAQNPELLIRNVRIKDIVSRTFEGDQQHYILRMVEEVLFTRMPSLHTYVDARFKIFLTLTSLRPRAKT